MNVLPDFLKPLEFLVRPFPARAVEEAVLRHEESTPHLLAALEWADQHTAEANGGNPPYMLHLFALFLLAQFRETRAHPLIASLGRNAEIDALTGDVITEHLHRILASVCGGDTSLIEGLIEDPTVDEWVRGAAVSALGVLLHNGVKTRAQISAYVGALLATRLERKPGNVWDSTIALCTDFSLSEHLAAIRESYRADLADPFCDALEDVEKELVLPPDTSTRWQPERHAFIDDTIAEVETWYCFTEKAEEEEKSAVFNLAGEDEREFDDDDFPGIPVIREAPKIGRNDQCPCGSGKKYKKCCGAAGKMER